MTEPLVEKCDFCGRRTYACRFEPGGKACPPCRRARREKRCEEGLEKPLPNCECKRCRPKRALPLLPERAESQPEPDPSPPAPEGYGGRRGARRAGSHADAWTASQGGTRRAGVLATPQERAAGAQPEPPGLSGLRVPMGGLLISPELLDECAAPDVRERFLSEYGRCTCACSGPDRLVEFPDRTCPTHGRPFPIRLAQAYAAYAAGPRTIARLKGRAAAVEAGARNAADELAEMALGCTTEREPCEGCETPEECISGRARADQARREYEAARDRALAGPMDRMQSALLAYWKRVTNSG